MPRPFRSCCWQRRSPSAQLSTGCLVSAIRSERAHDDSRPRAAGDARRPNPHVPRLAHRRRDSGLVFFGDLPDVSTAGFRVALVQRLFRQRRLVALHLPQPLARTLLGRPADPARPPPSPCLPPPPPPPP